MLLAGPGSGGRRARSQNAAGQFATMVAVLEEDAAVDDGKLDPARFGYEAPSAAREVEANLRALRAADLIEIENRHIGGHARLQHTAVSKAEKRGGFGGDALDRMLERERAPLPHEGADE